MSHTVQVGEPSNELRPRGQGSQIPLLASKNLPDGQPQPPESSGKKSRAHVALPLSAPMAWSAKYSATVNAPCAGT
eukprot:2384772-Prymnesium_polylepis.1